MARAGGLKRMVESRLADIDAREINSIPIGADRDGEPIVVRVGRYGPYVSEGERRGDEPRQPAGGPGARRADRREGARAAGAAER